MEDKPVKKSLSGSKSLFSYALRGIFGAAVLAVGIAAFYIGTGIFVLATTVNMFIDLAVSTGLIPLLIPLVSGAALIVAGTYLTAKTAFSFFKERGLFGSENKEQKSDAASLSRPAFVSPKVTLAFNGVRNALKRKATPGHSGSRFLHTKKI